MVGLVLCGGRSSRMGRDKIWIEIEGRPMLLRVLDSLVPITSRVLLLAGAEQGLPPLPERVEVLRDSAPYAGPLVALARGLEAIDAGDGLVFLCAGDMPRLAGSVVQRLADLAEGREAAIFEEGGFPQLLAGAYRAAIRDRVEALVSAGERSLRALLSKIDARMVSRAELLEDPRVAAEDPELRSFFDVDAPEDIERA